ncbi:MAG: ABC transporter ATP-binding protein [Candidatus Obscuribacterales bacterium]
MQKANEFQRLEIFEDVAVQDEVELLKEESRRQPMNFVYLLGSLGRELIAVISVMIVLGTIHPVLACLVALSVVPHAIGIMKFHSRQWDLALFRSPLVRKMAWLSRTAFEPISGIETRLFNSGPFLEGHYQRLSEELNQTGKRERLKHLWLASLLSTLGTCISLGVVGWVIHRAYMGMLTAQDIVITIQGVIVSQQELARSIQSLSMISPPLKFYSSLRKFLSIKYCRPKVGYSVSVVGNIEFKELSFHYTNGHQALDNVSFQIRRGQKLAIVGENGAGKSTLIKLLMGFYHPTGGAIFVDGRDLETLDVREWRSRLSGIFQEFGRYHLTVRENLGIADPDKIGDLVALEEAAKRSGFDTVLNRLPSGIETSLGKEFGGVDLSGGEWQKLALGRVFLRDADVLIFDEPSAALDARAEQEFFAHMQALSRSKTAIFITHRLQSVVMADWVVVLKGGRVIEQDTPQNLLATGGEFAKLYRLQTKNYGEVKVRSTVDQTI